MHVEWYSGNGSQKDRSGWVSTKNKAEKELVCRPVDLSAVSIRSDFTKVHIYF